MEGLLAPDPGSPLGQSRARVLDLLREAGSPMGVQEVADRTGLHPNTARFHLDGLVEAGLATPSGHFPTSGRADGAALRCRGGVRDPGGR